MIADNLVSKVQEQVEQNIQDLPKEYKALYPHISSWLIRTVLEIGEKEICGACGLRKSLDEALNTGDGVYRP